MIAGYAGFEPSNWHDLRFHLIPNFFTHFCSSLFSEHCCSYKTHFKVSMLSNCYLKWRNIIKFVLLTENMNASLMSVMFSVPNCLILIFRRIMFSYFQNITHTIHFNNIIIYIHIFS